VSETPTEAFLGSGLLLTAVASQQLIKYMTQYNTRNKSTQLLQTVYLLDIVIVLQMSCIYSID